MTSSIPLCRVRAPAMSPSLTISSLRMRHMSSAHGPCQDGKTNAHLQNHLVANGPLEMTVFSISHIGSVKTGSSATGSPQRRLREKWNLGVCEAWW